MDRLIRQSCLSGLIGNFKANTLKEGRAHFTEEFLVSCKTLLGQYWTEFCENHNALREDGTQHEGAYSTEDKYSSVEL